MRKINAFAFLTLNGFYKDQNNDTSWHKHGGEEGEFSEEQLRAGNILLFGRTTYEMMQGFWPTKEAYELFPKVAEGMNKAEKLVVSKSLKKAEWGNTKILNDIDEISKLKSTQGKNITILGSGSIVTQLTGADLIDEYEFMIDPLAIGHGTTILSSLKEKLQLKLTDTRVFKKSGIVL